MSNISPLYIKATVAGATAGALDRYFCNKPNIGDNATTAVSVAGGILAGSYINTMIGTTFISSDTSATPMYSGPEIQERLLEVGGAGLAMFILSKYANYNRDESMVKKKGIIVVSDVVGELAGDYFAGQPLAFLV